MSLADLNPQFVLISLLLKCIFLIIVVVELLLPRLKRDELLLSWRTDLETELQNKMMEGGAFLFSIGLVVIFDVIAKSDSWLPFLITITIDLLLAFLILYLLFRPKLYGITESGINHQGLILKWELMLSYDHTSSKLKIKTKGLFRENHIFPLPKDADKRMDVLARIRGELPQRQDEKPE